MTMTGPISLEVDNEGSVWQLVGGLSFSSFLLKPRFFSSNGS